MKKYSLIMQFISIVGLTISLIVSLITNNYSYTYIIAGIFLLVSAYNNHEFYKRKYMTIIYLITGLLVVIMGVLNAIGR